MCIQHKHKITGFASSPKYKYMPHSLISVTFFKHFSGQKVPVLSFPHFSTFSSTHSHQNQVHSLLTISQLLSFQGNSRKDPKLTSDVTRLQKPLETLHQWERNTSSRSSKIPSRCSKHPCYNFLWKITQSTLP